MDPRLRRFVFTIVIVFTAVSVVFLPPLLRRNTPADEQTPASEVATESPSTTGTDDSSSTASPGSPDSPALPREEGAEHEQPTAPDEPSGEPLLRNQADLFTGLRPVAPEGGIRPDQPRPLGSLDWREARYQVEFSTFGAGVSRLVFSDFWNDAPTKRRVERLKRQIERGESTLADLPDESRYVLIRSRSLQYLNIRASFDPLAARGLSINGQPYIDLNLDVWSETAPGRFVTEIRNEADVPVLRIHRVYRMSGDSYDLTLEQRLDNLTAEPVRVQWVMYGPSDLDQDPSRYFEDRRWRVGYRPDPTRYPTVVHGTSNILWPSDVIGKVDKARRIGVAQAPNLWPTPEAVDSGYDLAWYGATNRYFAFVIHPAYEGTPPPEVSLADLVESIRPNADYPLNAHGEALAPTVAFTELHSPARTIEPGGTLALDIGIYAGPLDRQALHNAEPYDALNMGVLILYQMSAMCAWCTFQWLAHLLIFVLSFFHDWVLFDWGLAIIALVVIVRALLHPITKKSQISMQRFGRTMQKLKPEIDKLQKKYANEPKRAQQEQFRLMREHNVNPLGCLGFLPMLLQTPIWIALYAMLYFAFELRQEAAFFGIFQWFGNWPFLADLSASDHFFWKFETPKSVWVSTVTGLNLLPILMGGIFYFQHKYMMPPSTGTMSKEMEQQQKIMRFMMVVMFPVFLYPAPSGLTLYIITSSLIGIVESRYIRRHVDQMDLTAPPPKKPAPTKVNRKDPVARAYELAQERVKEKQKDKNTKSFKRRK